MMDKLFSRVLQSGAFIKVLLNLLCDDQIAELFDKGLGLYFDFFEVLFIVDLVVPGNKIGDLLLDALQFTSKVFRILSYVYLHVILPCFQRSIGAEDTFFKGKI